MNLNRSSCQWSGPLDEWCLESCGNECYCTWWVLFRVVFQVARPAANAVGCLQRWHCWSFLVDDSIVRNVAQHALQYFFQVRPSVLHLFSSLITFIRCSSYRLKPSISTFHSSSYHLLQLFQLLKSLFLSTLPTVATSTPRELVEQLLIDDL